MKAIILAGGQGKRLYPQTKVINKHLLSIYDKPMIYYPLSLAMLSKIKDIAIVCNQKDKKSFFKLLGDGSNLGIKINYFIQKQSDGIVGALKTCEKFISNNKIMVLLGDNIFYGNELIKYINKPYKSECVIFSHSTSNYKNFGVAEYKNEKIFKIHEKPKKFYSTRIIVGLYIFNKNLLMKMSKVKKSKRGEYEITDIINQYIRSNKCTEVKLNRGITWFDTGTFDDFLKASNFLQIVHKEQSLSVGLIESIAYLENFISKKKFVEIIKKTQNPDYKKKLLQNIV